MKNTERRWDFGTSEVVAYNPSKGVQRPQDADVRLKPKRVAARPRPMRAAGAHRNAAWGL